MIRKFLPAFVLILLALVCTLTAVGALAGAMAIWLSRYWGLGGALIAIAFFFLLLALFSYFAAWLWAKVASKRSDPLSDTIEGLWKAHPGTLMAITSVVVFLAARKPALIVRTFGALAKSTGAILLFRKLL